MARRYHQGQTVYAYYYNYSDEDQTTLVDCDSGYPKYTLTDSDGTAKVDAQAMTKTATGTYKYDTYDIPSDGTMGWWNELVEARTNTDITIIYDGFRVI